MKQIFEMLISLLVEGVLAYIAAIDILKKKITNRSLIILGAVGIAATYRFPISIAKRLWGGMINASALFLIDLVRPGAFGGGDIKLLAIAGFLLGIRGGFLALCAAFLSGGIYSALLLLIGKMKRKDNIAFGPFICLGIVLGFVYSL